jgi:four helix bundle protein
MAGSKRFEEIMAWQKGRELVRETYRICEIAPFSKDEVQSLLYVARDLNYIQPAEFERLYKIAEETISLIGGFTSYLRNQSPR